MSNPILDILEQLRRVDSSGGYERYQFTLERLNQARQALRASGDDCVPYLKRCLRDTDLQIQRWAVEICDATPEAYTDDVTALLRFQLKLEEKRTARQNSQLILNLKQMLKQLGDTMLVDEAKTGLQSDDVEERKQALLDLSKDLRDNKEIVIEVVRNDVSPEVRDFALQRLSQLRDDASLLDLYQVTVNDDNPIIRASTIHNVAQLCTDDDRITGTILNALDDEVLRVQLAAIHNLNQRSIPETVPRLMQLLSEVPAGFVWTVAQGLRWQILKFNNVPDDWQPLLAVLDRMEAFPGWNKHASSAIEALQKVGDLSVMPYFVRYMLSEDQYEGNPKDTPGRVVIQLLKTMREHMAWQAFEMALQPYIDSKNTGERRVAIGIIGEVGGADGRPLLEHMRHHETDASLINLIDQYLE